MLKADHACPLTTAVEELDDLLYMNRSIMICWRSPAFMVEPQYAGERHGDAC